jgi:hypothetical protein
VEQEGYGEIVVRLWKDPADSAMNHGKALTFTHARR